MNTMEILTIIILAISIMVTYRTIFMLSTPSRDAWSGISTLLWVVFYLLLTNY